VEILLGFVFLKIGPDWKGAGHFLSGIGSVVLLGGIIWVKSAPSAGRLPMLGWAAFWLVQLQGLLGGLRVVLDAQVVADVRMGTAFGILHGCLAQGFLVLLAVIALMTSGWWMGSPLPVVGAHGVTRPTNLRRWFLFATILIFIQLLIAATMRHQHAGLAISDFPLAHGKLWPDMSADAVAGYNARRVEVTTSDAITAFQIGLQMAHRIVACLILAAVSLCAWKARLVQSLKPLAFAWLGLILIQACLGAWTIWSNKAADVATAHVVVGALSLVTGSLGCLISYRRQTASESPSDFSR
jgi:cytochrome c oxidase assembly protein subunit 15